MDDAKNKIRVELMIKLNRAQTYFFIVLVVMFQLCSSLAIAALPPAARDQQYDEYEGLDLVQALLNDGKTDAADKTLKSMKSEAQSKRRLVLQGDIHFANGAFGKALIEYQAALTRQPSADVFAKVGETHFQLKNYRDCQNALMRAADFVYSSENLVLHKATCEWELRDVPASWATLWQGMQKLNAYPIFSKKIWVMMQLGLHQQALLESFIYLRRMDAKPTELLSLSELLGKNAQLLLEVARLRWPMDRDLQLAVVPLYFEKQWMRAIAESFERASWNDKKYIYHAGEIYRQLGHVQKAYWLNLQVVVPKEQFRQRMALLVDDQRWDLIAAMDQASQWNQDIIDDEARYALAFSLTHFGLLQSAQAHLAAVRSQSLLTKVASLTKTVTDCQQQSWQCRY